MAEASNLDAARPFPLFQITRWMPTSGGQAPVPMGLTLVGSFADFAARVAVGRSWVSWMDKRVISGPGE